MAVVYTNIPEYTGLGPDVDPRDWCHAINVKDGRVLEQNDHKFVASWLWMDENNNIDVDKGYMRRILKVYKITKKKTTEPAPGKRRKLLR